MFLRLHHLHYVGMSPPLPHCTSSSLTTRSGHLRWPPTKQGMAPQQAHTHTEDTLTASCTCFTHTHPAGSWAATGPSSPYFPKATSAAVADWTTSTGGGSQAKEFEAQPRDFQKDWWLQTPCCYTNRLTKGRGKMCVLEMTSKRHWQREEAANRSQGLHFPYAGGPPSPSVRRLFAPSSQHSSRKASLVQCPYNLCGALTACAAALLLGVPPCPPCQGERGEALCRRPQAQLRWGGKRSVTVEARMDSHCYRRTTWPLRSKRGETPRPRHQHFSSLSAPRQPAQPRSVSHSCSPGARRSCLRAGAPEGKGPAETCRGSQWSRARAAATGRGDGTAGSVWGGRSPWGVRARTPPAASPGRGALREAAAPGGNGSPAAGHCPGCWRGRHHTAPLRRNPPC